MITELKAEVEKTFGREIVNRGDCELLVDEVYRKTGRVISYNTLRRLFSIIPYRKPRESTLDVIAAYVGFLSFQDFNKRFAEVDNWPSWEHLYVVLSEATPERIVEFLRFRKKQQQQFPATFTIVIRELINRHDLHALQLIFREPMFQFEALPYDEVAQIGVLIGLHFRAFNNTEFELALLNEPNFRDVVFKIFVDYAKLNGKYGQWINYLKQLEGLDLETQNFVKCLHVWKTALNNGRIEDSAFESLPELNSKLHPILFGRILGLRVLAAKSNAARKKGERAMQQQLDTHPDQATELLYEIAVQALVFRSEIHEALLWNNKAAITKVSFWYHLSQVAIHRVYQVKVSLQKQQFLKAKTMLAEIPFGHIRHGYREFIELYVAFFRWHIAKNLNEPSLELELEFNSRKIKLNYPILDGHYFERYFDEN
jgi:hypothetical protein